MFLFFPFLLCSHFSLSSCSVLFCSVLFRALEGSLLSSEWALSKLFSKLFVLSNCVEFFLVLFPFLLCCHLSLSSCLVLICSVYGVIGFLFLFWVWLFHIFSPSGPSCTHLFSLGVVFREDSYQRSSPHKKEASTGCMRETPQIKSCLSLVTVFLKVFFNHFSRIPSC